MSGATRLIAAEEGGDALADIARAMLKTRRRRDRYFGENLSSDPIWDMLLDIYVSEAEGRGLSVTDLCVGSGVPMTTAHRYVKLMEARGLLFRYRNAGDGRVVLLGLSPEAKIKMQLLLEFASRQFG